MTYEFDLLLKSILIAVVIPFIIRTAVIILELKPPYQKDSVQKFLKNVSRAKDYVALVISGTICFSFELDFIKALFEIVDNKVDIPLIGQTLTTFSIFGIYKIYEKIFKL